MWKLSFISEKDVQLTIDKYREKLQSFDLKRFNKNIVDPIKLIFDKSVYRSSWEQIISNEIFRQRDKSNNNDIGYFHQTIFKYIEHCRVPNNGEDGGWDVIFENTNGIIMPDGSRVSRVYVEMKNKHNTMNSASSGKIQNQLLQDDDCECFLVKAIAKNSQNIKWEPKVDGQKMGHKYIRRVSLDQFYSLVTGQKDALYNMCMVLPEVINKAVSELDSSTIPNDTVFNEIRDIAAEQNYDSEDLSIAMAFYLLGFSSYLGFE
ncbi:type II restriction enzyme (Eco47II, Sau96I) [Streptococcus pneumoniae]|nr:type II restriction enzyme (Eco47II, Sau96I) [Streptococcus pneumoniae]VMF05343.1 type II restriction enzyme (Eco47II, Sau96I) [Streptococcus pneumoniae]VOA47759.1 type II restriction enzyme (Eco47II, Sau96I) [Streptococcus pneumoniae]VOA79002.1 type II restriction enzyme (Eco47II, Sau96I) [Streptococcus pneumoniae]VSU41127.1 type II restriction enzyme (Eco47II, Sau96I) [Streptococcus pneumoniae]